MLEENTDPHEFQRFHLLLIKNRPEYVPIYIKLKKNDKDPIKGVVWGKDSDPGVLSFAKALNAIEHGYNIGVVGREGDSQVTIDIDDMIVTPDSTMKPTLSMVSRSRIGRHYMYTTTDPEAKQNISPGEHVGEVRVDNQYVVCPGSYVPCDPEDVDAMPADQREFAGRYTIENDAAPVDITFAEFPKIFHDAIEKKKKDEIIKKQIDAARAAKRRERGDRDTVQWKFLNLSMSTVIGGIPGGERFPSPFHKSKTKKDTSYSPAKGLLTCWNHHVTHTASSALAVLAGVADCQSAGKGTSMGSAGPSTVDYGDPKTIYRMWTYAKREGMLPADDRIPQVAVLYVALEKKLCTAGELENGWKIPEEAYNRTLELIQAEVQVSVGRNPIGKPMTEKNGAVTRFRVINSDGFNAAKGSIAGLQVDTFWQGGEQFYQCGDRAVVTMWAEHKIIEIVKDDPRADITRADQVIPLITKVERVRAEEGVVYVYINGKKVKFPDTDIHNPNKWMLALFKCDIAAIFDKRSKEDKMAMNRLIGYVISVAETIWIDDHTKDDESAALLMDEITKLYEVDSEEKFMKSQVACLRKDGEILVRTTTILRLSRRILGGSMALNQVRNILLPFLSRKAQQATMAGRRESLWFFKGSIKDGDLVEI